MRERNWNISELLYKRRVQTEIDSYKNSDNEDKIDKIKVQDVLMIVKISI